MTLHTLVLIRFRQHHVITGFPEIFPFLVFYRTKQLVLITLATIMQRWFH